MPPGSPFRTMKAAFGFIAASLAPQGNVFAAPSLSVDPAVFNDDSLATPPPRLDYDPDAWAGEEPPDASFVNRREVPPVATQFGAEPQTLVLSPIVNGETQEGVFAVERSATGMLSAAARDLRGARIKVPAGFNDTDLVPLSSLPGLLAGYDEPNQALALEVPDNLRDPFLLRVTEPRDRVDLSHLQTTRNLQLNYRLQGTTSLSGGARDSLDGDVVLVASGGFSQFVGTGSFGTGRGFVRGESFFRLEDTARVRTYRLGDVVTGAVGISNAIRLGGLQVQSNFQQRPDIFRGPLPQFAGTAALPSTLDLYVDSLKVFSSKVPRGPFLLQSLPQISGRTLTVVTTDTNGREIQISRPAYFAPGLLRKGLAEYSLEAGFPRLGGSSTLGRYLDFFASSGTLRYGVTDRLTLEGHLESGGGLVNGGIGLAAALGYLGALNASFSISNLNGRTGGRIAADYQIGLGGLSGFYSLTREFGDYDSLGDVTALRALGSRPGGLASSLERGRESVDRIGIFFQLPFDPTTIDLAYNRIDLSRTRTRTVSAGFSRRLTDRLSLNGNALMDLENDHNIAARVTFSLRLGRFANASISGDRSRGVSNYAVTLNGFNAGRQNRLGYTLRQQGDDEGNVFRSGRIEYRLPQALLTGAIDQTKGNARAQFGLEGAVLFADNRLFPANRIGESFALIKNAGPGADILQNGRRIARSDRRGNAFLPELEAFDETRISLDPTQLPTDFEAQNGTEFIIVAARRNGAVVDFGVRKITAGIVVIVDKDGKPFPPGTQVMRESMEPEIMGYDGEVFLRDLKDENLVTIDRGEAGTCTASFAYSQEEADQPKIGPVTCQ